jgi:hypothetical protein
MGLFSKTKRKSKPYQAWLCEDARFFGKLSAEEQVEFINEQKRAKLETKAVRLELEALEHSFNRQSTELEKLRAAAGDRIGDSLLRAAHERILMLEKLNENKSLRLGVFDDMVSIFKSGRQDYRCADKYPSLTDEIENFLNKA